MRVGLGLPRGCVPSALLPAIANPGSGEWDWLGDGMERDLLEEVGNCRAERGTCAGREGGWYLMVGRLRALVGFMAWKGCK